MNCSIKSWGRRSPVKKIIEHLLSVKSVGLLTHVNPDWDCLGSCLALRTVLRERGVSCDILTDEPLSDYLSCFGDRTVVYDGGSLDGYDCLCCVDVGDSSRVGRMAGAFVRHRDRVCIDHHVGDGSFACLSYVDPSSPATGEIIFDMLKAAGIPLTREIGARLYCAISTDTGSFQYAAATAHTLDAAAEIMRLGVNTADLCEALYGRKSFRQLKLQGEALDTLRLHCGGRVATAYVDGEMYKKYDATSHDTEHLAAMPREIEGVVMSAFFTQRDENGVRVNLRAKGNYDVRRTAAVFGGGGHQRAAGCTLKGVTVDGAIEAVVAELEKELAAEDTGR